MSKNCRAVEGLDYNELSEIEVVLSSSVGSDHGYQARGVFQSTCQHVNDAVGISIPFVSVVVLSAYTIQRPFVHTEMYTIVLLPLYRVFMRVLMG